MSGGTHKPPKDARTADGAIAGWCSKSSSSTIAAVSPGRVASSRFSFEELARTTELRAASRLRVPSELVGRPALCELLRNPSDDADFSVLYAAGERGTSL